MGRPNKGKKKPGRYTTAKKEVQTSDKAACPNCYSLHILYPLACVGEVKRKNDSELVARMKKYLGLKFPMAYTHLRFPVTTGNNPSEVNDSKGNIWHNEKDK